MAKHVVFGAGVIGRGIAAELVTQGHDVILASRSGAGPDVPGVERVAVDASQADDATALASGAAAIYNCLNPPYHLWPVEWPPLAAALLTAAESSGAVLVTVSNLYAYGQVTGPMTEDMPLAATGAKGRGPGADVCRGASRSRGRPDPYDRAARVGLPRTGC